jgi:hypothetical protein
MATSSQHPTYIAADGLPTEEDNDSQIFGYGTLAQRPASGDVTGDIYIVLDPSGGVYEWNVWNGSNWENFQSEPIGGTSGTQGDVLYRDATNWTTLAAGTAYQFLQTLGSGANPAWASYKVYPAAGTDPSSPTPAAGDLYFNTGLSLWMMYDGTRTKWLSVESSILGFGRGGATPAGSYFNGTDGVSFSAAQGLLGVWNGTVVSLGYTRSNTTSTTFEVTADGVAISTLASAATSGYTVSLNNDFSQGDVLGVRNQSGGGIARDIQGWVRVKWRI